MSKDLAAQLIANGLTSGSAYALIALGFAIAYNTSRFFNLAYGGLYTLAAYSAFAFHIQLGWPMSAAVFGSLVVIAVAVGLIDIAVYRPMRRRSANSLAMLIASLGLYILLQNLISMIWGDAVVTIQSGRVGEGYVLVGARITSAQLLIVAVTAVTLMATWASLRFTRPGVVLRALGEDTELVRLSGINADRFVSIGHIAAGLLTAVAAVTASLDVDLKPTMGFNVLTKGIVAFIIGGTGSLVGAAIGGLFLGIVENLAVWQLPSKWVDAVAFCVLVLFLILRPQGILGQVGLKRARA